MGEFERKDRRKRSPNFTNDEIRLLIKLCYDFKHIIENKKTDSTTSEEKNRTWQKVAEYFNAASGICYRNTETLKNRYESMKKSLKRKVTHNKQENLKTGGGMPDYKKLEDFEISLLEIVQTQVNGLISIYDSDSVLPKTTISGELFSDNSENEGENIINHEEMCEIVVEEEKFEDIFIEHDYTPRMDESQTLKSPDTKTTDTHTVAESVSDSAIKWRTWSPTILKSKKNPLLVTQKKKAAHCEMLTSILEERKELVKLQIQKINNEEKRVKEKHEKEIELLNLEIEIKKKILNM